MTRDAVCVVTRKGVQPWIGWPLLFVHFFLPEPWGEVTLAVQTFVCAFFRDIQSYHVATTVVLMQYITSPSLDSSLIDILIYHLTVFCAIVGQYTFRTYRPVCWVMLFWTLHWLDMGPFTAWRYVLKCVLFRQLSLFPPGRGTHHGGFKWCWILIVHEWAWCLLPFQMLYEVYVESKIKTQPLFV